MVIRLTNAQIKKSLEMGGTTDGIITPMTGFVYFTFLKFDNKICDIKNNRYKFSFIGDSCLVYCYKCKEYSGSLLGLTEGVHYDKYNGKTYLYLLDNNNEPICDIYDGKEILLFCLKEG